MDTKVAIVTGNNKGLGKALSNKLVELGYKQPMFIKSSDFDLTKVDDAKSLVDSVLENEGQFDLLVNNVGNYTTAYIDDLSIDAWHEMINSNLHSAFYMSKFAIEELRKTQGKIINIGFCGLNKLSPPPELVAYQVAKTGLLTLTKAMAKAEAKHGVCVNMISPGSMENSVEKDTALERIPMQRLANFEEVINAVKLCLTNDYITGQNIEIAGGRAL